MSIPISSIYEITDALKYVSIVRISFNKNKNWVVFPIYKVNESSVDLIISNKENQMLILEQDKVLIKFQSKGYEFHIEAIVKDITDFNLLVIDFYGFKGIKYLITKHVRFDIELKACIIEQNEFPAIVKNISMGGALISAKELELGGYYDLKIFLNDTEEFLTKVKILRKVIVNDNFEYGVKFEELTGKNQSILSREIVKFEKKNLDSFRSMKGNSYNNYDKKINILNYNKIENVDIRETLMKIGAGNYEVLYNFKYLLIFILETRYINYYEKYNINSQYSF